MWLTKKAIEEEYSLGERTIDRWLADMRDSGNYGYFINKSSGLVLIDKDAWDHYFDYRELIVNGEKVPKFKKRSRYQA